MSSTDPPTSSAWQAPSSNLVGVAWAALAVGIFAFIYVSGKLTASPASALQIIWLRYVGGLVCILMIWGVRRRPLSTRQVPAHAARALAGGLGGAAAVHAATQMPVAAASAIGLMDGIFTVALGVLLLKERVSARQYAAAVLCFIGALAVVAGRGGSQAWHTIPVGPALVALAGTFLVAVESLLIKRLARSESLLSTLVYVNAFGTLIFAVPAVPSWVELPVGQLALFLSLGPMALVAQGCNILALRRCDVSLIGPVRYLWVVYGLILGTALFEEVPTPAALAGAALVLAGGLWLALSRAPRLHT